MWPYLLVVGLFAVAAVTSQPRAPNRVAWMAAFLVLLLFVGLRHHVGMDWNNYLRMIDKAARAQTLDEYWRVAEPGFTLLLYLGDRSGAGIYLANLLGTAVFVVGLFAFARRTPEPWLALIVALPFFVIAFSMSANRQAISAGILLIVFAYWSDWSVVRKVAVILFATLFHSSAIVMLAFIGTSLNIPFRIKVIAVGIFVLGALYFLQVTGQAEYYDNTYGRGQTAASQSAGALIHVALNAVPASLYLLWPRMRQVLFPNKLMRDMAIAAVLVFPLAFIMSTAAARVSLYFYPVSMFAIAALPQVVTPNSRPLVRGTIATLMMLELTGWLLLANHSGAHLPYRNALFTPNYELHIGIVR
jgi:hypothetical protein